MMQAFLHSIRDGRAYHVELDGELIVVDSRDPEPDMARVLLARGITGKITVCDAVTRKPRTAVDIERVAKIRTDDLRMRFDRWKPFQLASVPSRNREADRAA
jgi:hypothetical protein